ncbi:MAG TPA: P1 family peptidase [Nocardioides sp.]|nr:P1 family peptidase [Nocardioides sp.]
MTTDPPGEDRGRAPRARDLGVPFDGRPGPWNAITDVPGVEVGFETIVADGPDGVARTGVTVLLPLGREGTGRSCAAGWFSLNGNGELTGTAWIDESGSLTGPVGITNTNAVGPVHRGIVDWMARAHPELLDGWMLPVVGETWDGYLNDINADHVTPAATGRALDAARGGEVPEGSVGGGTGMNCYGFKAGTGTSSRQVEVAGRSYTVGVLLQANFGRRSELTIAGRRVGAQLVEDNPVEDAWLAPPGAGSCIAVVATDAPLLPGQCTALARRVSLGLGRTGTTGSHFSGDLFLAFSTANPGALDSVAADPAAPLDRLPAIEFLPWGLVNPVYDAVVQCTEEAVVNALVAGREMVGRDGHRSPAFPVDRLPELLGA